MRQKERKETRREKMLGEMRREETRYGKTGGWDEMRGKERMR